MNTNESDGEVVDGVKGGQGRKAGETSAASMVVCLSLWVCFALLLLSSCGLRKLVN